MILGRETPQWIAIITGTLSFVQVLVGVLRPDIDQGQLALVLGSLGTLLAGYLAFLARTKTTPYDDPMLKANTQVTVTDDAGTVIGQAAVPTPAPAPIAQDVAR